MNIIMQWNIQMNKKLAMKHGVKMKSKRKKREKHSFKQCMCQFLVRSFCLVWFLISRQGLVLTTCKSDFPLLWKDGKRDLVSDSFDQYLFQPMKLRCYEFLSIKHCLRYVHYWYIFRKGLDYLFCASIKN